MIQSLEHRRDRAFFNGVWIILGLVLGSCLYLVLTFIPPWYKTLSAKEKIGEIISGHTMDGLDEDALSETISEKLKAMGVDVTTSDVEINLDKTSRMATVRVTWVADVPFPLTRRKTQITFHIRSKKQMQ